MVRTVILLLIVIFAFPRPAFALLPPDIIFSVGTSVVQFFSVAALVVGGVFSSVVLATRKVFFLSKKKVWLLIIAIFSIVLLAIVAVSFAEIKRQEEQYLSEISILRLANLNLTKQNTSINNSKRYLDDHITIYSDNESLPFALELDFNRIEKSNGVFTHYTFLHGYIDGVLIDDYDEIMATSTELKKNYFVENIERSGAPDFSTRDTYQGRVLVNGEPLTFTITGLEGDFVTRNVPEYTRLQSVGEAEVSYKGKTFMAQTLVENAYSSDPSKYIFFPGYSEVEATTHQFILWDEDNNFYLIDSSELYSDTPQYPSHTWLLYKNAAEQSSRKSFEATIAVESDKTGAVFWSVQAPAFENASFSLSSPLPFLPTAGARVNTVVTGTVTDDKGTRTIGGGLHYIE